jgi:hypothetical protein
MRVILSYLLSLFWLSNVGYHLSAATVNVQEFGAAGDGFTDDTAAIQAASNASADGDLIYFPPGVYLISDAIYLANNRTYAGVYGQSVLIQVTPYVTGFWTTGPADKIIIDSLVFYGGGVTVEWYATNITIQYCSFFNLSTPSGVFFPNGGQNIAISGNVFQNSSQSVGITIWNQVLSVSIVGNYIYNFYQGISMAYWWGGDPSDKVVYDSNTIWGIARMGIEHQATTQTVVLVNNVVGGWVQAAQAFDPQYPTCYGYSGFLCESFGFSIVSGGVAHIIGNTLWGTPGTAFGMELAVGRGSEVTGNSIAEFSLLISEDYSDPSIKNNIGNNLLCGGFVNENMQHVSSWSEPNQYYPDCSDPAFWSGAVGGRTRSAAPK